MTTPPRRTPARLREERERWCLLLRLQRWLEIPMMCLGVAWLALVVVELTRGLSPFLERVGTAVWLVFVADFALRLVLAPRRGRYLRRHWLTAVSLVVPALRVFRVWTLVRVLRVARTARGLRLVKVVSSLNRGMRGLDRALRRRGFGYVVAFTALVAPVGAAGMYAFEQNPGGPGLNSYSESLWWTAMLLTTVGSEYWPRTPEGRLLTLFLAIYALSIFGYLAATLASLFVGREAERSAVAAVRQERGVTGAPRQGDAVRRLEE
jgi:voltage-gated potassium channel